MPTSPRPANASQAELLACSPHRAEILASLTAKEKAALEYEWPFWARPAQLAPLGDWRTWLVIAGRGFGKTRTGAEWIRNEAKDPNARMALVAPTAADARDVMVEGESGILSVSPPWCRPRYEPSKRRLTWPNGALAMTYSAEEPDRLRGPQHTAAWADELAAWKYPDTWDQLQFGLRLGAHPRSIVTTTPRPTALVKRLMKDPTSVVSRGSTFDNRANLAASFIEEIRKKYEGTRLGQQELYAVLLDDIVGALWTYGLIESLRVTKHPDLRRIVVAIDPAVTASEDSDETGLVVAGLGTDGHGYVLEDVSGRYTPDEWARLAVRKYHDWKADRVVAEVNNGGDLVERVLRTVDKHVSYKAVRATRGKVLRAEPVQALDQQGKVHHVGLLAKLEDQMCQWTPLSGEKSPDRIDARVWALTELMLSGGGAVYEESPIKAPERDFY